MFEINSVSVLAAAVASMAVGFLWYSPMLFGNQWTALVGWTKSGMKKNRSGMSMMYLFSFVGAIIMAFVLTQFGGGYSTAFWAWLGFVMPVQLTDVIFGGKKPMLFAINTSYQLVSLLVMAFVISVL